MSTPRFYVGNQHAAPFTPSALLPGSLVALTESAAMHASRALRLTVGDAAILFNGDGHDYACTLVEVNKNAVTARVESSHAVSKESPLRVTLAQGISSGDRMDFTIQKAVEMGVTAIQPIASQRSVVKLSGERADKRREHWQNVVIAACEQSGRAVVPPVSAPLPLAQWLATTLSFTTRITLAPGATQALQTLPVPDGEICLLIGAEGGLTEEEIALAASRQFTPIRLGQRVLRTETAALAALAAIQTLWGDF